MDHRRGGLIGEVVLVIEAIITPIFLVDFAHRLKTADSRSDYVVDRYGWPTSSRCFRFFVVLGIVRVLRVLQRIDSSRPDTSSRIRAARALATFLVTLFVIVVTEVAGATIYFAEGGAEGANIASASDAIWWHW